MWCVQEASCDFPCCNGYFYSTKKGRSVPNPPPIPSNSFRKSQSYTQEYSLQPSLAYSQIPSLALFRSLSLSHRHTNHQAQQWQKETQNPKWVTFDPLQQPGRIWREWWRWGGSWGGRRKTERAARRTEVPRAGNTGRVKPLEWSLHQSGRHNLRPMYSIPKRPNAYGPVTARIRLLVIRSMDVMASQSQHELTAPACF